MSILDIYWDIGKEQKYQQSIKKDQDVDKVHRSRFYHSHDERVIHCNFQRVIITPLEGLI